MFKIFNERNEFFQWDMNQKLIVEDETITEVHFNNGTYKTAFVVEVRKENGLNVADVPNILLQENWDITAYAFLKDFTKQEQVFKVIARAKPDNYVYEETKVLSWGAALEKIDKELEKVGYYQPKVENGVLSWKASSAGLPAVLPANIKGEKGETGAQGLKGETGEKGDKPIYGVDYLTQPEIDQIVNDVKNNVQSGIDGKSAYQIAVDNGFTGTQQEWLNSLHGADGKDGDKGETGAAGANGKDGKNGIDGKDGYTPVKGVDYFDGKDGAAGAKGDKGETGAAGANGKDGAAGKDATINGVNTLTITQGENIALSQTGSNLTISAASGGEGSERTKTVHIQLGKANLEYNGRVNNFLQGYVRAYSPNVFVPIKIYTEEQDRNKQLILSCNVFAGNTTTFPVETKIFSNMENKFVATCYVKIVKELGAPEVYITETPFGETPPPLLKDKRLNIYYVWPLSSKTSDTNWEYETTW